MKYPFPIRDRQAEYCGEFDRRLGLHVLKLATDEAIEEHRRRPIGQHSDALERLLNYLRRGQMAGKLGILDRESANGRFALLRFSGVRGEPPEVLRDPESESLDAAYHAIFLMRLAALREAANGWNR